MNFLLGLKLLRPVGCTPSPRVGAQLNTKLTFDIENAEHEFGEGRVENSDCEVTIAYTIRPSDWDERLWGYTVIINICL